jgi:O-6-methylguanine DNA methyltransferase
MRGMVAVVSSPVGNLRIVASADGVERLEFTDGPALPPSSGLLAEAGRQLRAYFEGSLREFDLPLRLQGSEHDLAHWRQLLAIPYGETRTYADIARVVGAPAGARAVGQANARNPVAIVVPCHRVVRTGGALGGYGGGVWRKQWLLDHESGQPSLLA